MPLALFYSLIAILFSFILVNSYSFLQEKRKIKTKLKNNESYILFWLHKIIINIDKYLEGINEFYTTLKEWDNIKPIYFNRVTLPLSKIQELSPVDLYSTFVENKKDIDSEKKKYYSNLVNGLEFLDRKSLEIKDRVDSFLKSNANYRMEMSKMWMELEENRIQLLQTNHENILKDEFLNLYYHHHKQNPSPTLKNIHGMYNKYMVPLNEICDKMLYKYQKDLRIPHIQKKVFLFKQAYDLNKANKELLETYLVDIMNMMKEYKIKLNNVFSYFELLKFKMLFKLN